MRLELSVNQCAPSLRFCNRVSGFIPPVMQTVVFPLFLCLATAAAPAVAMAPRFQPDGSSGVRQRMIRPVARTSVRKSKSPPLPLSMLQPRRRACGTPRAPLTALPHLQIRLRSLFLKREMVLAVEALSDASLSRSARRSRRADTTHSRAICLQAKPGNCRLGPVPDRQFSKHPGQMVLDCLLLQPKLCGYGLIA